jgi:hypothetical protein
VHETIFFTTASSLNMVKIEMKKIPVSWVKGIISLKNYYIMGAIKIRVWKKAF